MVGRRVELETVKPQPVAGSAVSEAFGESEEATRCAVVSAPFLRWVKFCPSVCYAANLNELLQKSERLWRSRTRDRSWLGVVVRNEADGVVEGAVFSFCCQVKGWKPVGGGMKHRLQVMAG